MIIKEKMKELPSSGSVKAKLWEMKVTKNTAKKTRSRTIFFAILIRTLVLRNWIK